MTDMTASADPRQVELMKLQKEYRNMEINRRAYAEESQALLRKQQSSIDKLRKDNEILKSDIALLMRGSNRPLSTLQQETIQTLADQGDKYANFIEFERDNIAIMEEQIEDMKRKTLQQRRAMGGINASKDNHFMIQKQIRILENRLDKSLIKFNEAISHNKDLRDKIDELRRERVVFENVYRKMERELQDRKRKMAEIIEVSNQSYEQRDKYQMEIAAIEQANRKEQEEFEEQMVTLGAILDNELAMPSTAKLGNRTKSLTRLSKRNSGTASPEQTMHRTGSSAGGNTISSIAKDDDDINFKARAQNFEEAFNKIKAATGISDLDELVKTFIKNEEHNFSLFNYVNEQNNEIEKYEEQIQSLREEEMKFKQETGNDVNQHKEILKDLESKLQTSDAMAEKYDQRCQDLQRIIESLKHGQQAIFSKFDFETEDGQVPIVSDTNMVHYLGLIEKKANVLLQNYANIRQYMIQATEHTAALSQGLDPALSGVMGTGPKVPMGAELLHVNPPRADDYQSDDDEEIDEDDARPLTRDELKTRTMNRMQRRLQGLASGAGAAGTGGGGGGQKAAKKSGVKK
jgi:hypothetical protein